MTVKRTLDPQFDLFVPFVADLPLRDQRETMERPFFSLAKRKRLKPIQYVSPDGSIYVDVFPNAQFGMATIWDADILIWAASVLNTMKKAGHNDLPRTLNFQAYDLLKTIGRGTGGREYHLLREGLGRLQATTIKTNIRPKGRKKERQFSWIESWTDLMDDKTNQSLGMTLTVSEWFYEGILMDGGLLSIDPAYFSISGGRERWIYRVARKHAGGAGPDGFTIPFPTLFEKSGAEGTYRRFKFELLAIIRSNALPGYDLTMEAGRGEPSLRMTRRAIAETAAEQMRPLRAVRSSLNSQQVSPLPLFQQLTDDTLTRVRRDFPGWDVYAAKAEFDAWIEGAPDRAPADYQRAFYGFVRRMHTRQHV
jgi:plasmid replication initiation protein